MPARGRSALGAGPAGGSRGEDRPSGLGAAIRLRRAGITDLAGLEKADEIGGTWRANT